MEKFKTLSDEYKILKKHYKLIPKKEWDLDSINFRKTAGFKNFVSHTVDEARSWRTRAIIAWAIINGLGFVMAYLIPLFQGGQWNG